LAPIREIAAEAGVDKNTVVRVERGMPVRMETFRRLCAALGTSTGRQSLELADPSDSFRVSRAADRIWEKEPERTSPEDMERLSIPTERWRQGWAGEQGGFNGFLDCELYGGILVSSVIELFERSTIRSFHGEELIFCLRGQVTLQVNSTETKLLEGDAVCLKAIEPHWCGPTHAVKPGEPPPMILSVRVEN